MKYIYTIALLLALSGTRIHAQKVDTSLTQMGLKSKIFSADSVRYAIYDYAKRSPFYLSDLMPIQYSIINGGYGFEKGKLMAAQNAEKIQNSYLQTEGSTHVGSVRLWGLFSYLKSYEDSTMYNHQTRNNSSVPFYFGSPINVKYERSVYKLKAMAEKELLKKNLPFGLGADYRIGNHFSSNDPRGSINDFQFNLIATIGYHLSEKLKLGAAYRFGYGQELIDIGYKNTSYTQSNVKPEYTNYLINGYGEAWEAKNILEYDNDQDCSGLDLYINYQSIPAGTFLFSYGRINEKQKFTNRSSDGFANYGRYQFTDDNFNLFWLKKLDKDQLSINLAYLNRDGKDFNYVFEQNNYLYNYSQLSAKAIFSVQKNKTQYNYTLSANKNSEERQDGITGNLVGYNKMHLNAGWGFSKTTRQSHHWGLSLNGLYAFSFDNDYHVPEIANGKFTKMVILYDYLYNTASVLGGNFNADYSFPAFKGVQAGIKLGVSYLQRTDMATMGSTTLNTPGKDRFSSNASINLYF